MPLLALPNELILQIARCLLQSSTCRCDCDCHFHHISPHLAAFSRVNHHFHALLVGFPRATSSTVHMLFWAIANSRPDTVSLALELGTDPNSTLRPNFHITACSYLPTTPVDLAISMRVHSLSAESHALKLSILALLFAAGATCTVDNLVMPTRYGDLELLTLCLPHLTHIADASRHSGLRTLLKIAARRGHVETAKLTISAGAAVNSIGDRQHPQFFPPLWVYHTAPLAVLQVLLDAGADATWRSNRGVSVLQNMQRRAVDELDLEEKVALLVRYGAVDEGSSRHVRGAGGMQPGTPSEVEHRGWVPCSDKVPIDWPREWEMAGSEQGCGCVSEDVKVAGTGG